MLALLSVGAAAWVWRNGWTLYYGDAVAHLNIARRILDSRTPGYYQIGTVWLPLPHVLMLPFVRDDRLWQTGLAGVFPTAVCFVAAGAFFYAAARERLSSRAAAGAALAALALNPNLLYLQSTPMTEPVFLAGLGALAYFTVRFRRSQSVRAVTGAALAALASTLTRYEGWFLIPFVALYFLWAAEKKRWQYAIFFTAVASLGPLYWLAHNWIWWGDWLEFYRGPYSAKAIYQRALDAGMARYPGDQDWAKAWLQFRSAATLCVGQPLVWLAGAGLGALVWRRAVWPLGLLALPPIFYVWSIHSGATPIFVPHLWPHSYYNTRYGVAALPLLAFAAGALVMLFAARWRGVAAALVALVAVGPWLLRRWPEDVITWKESQVNSEARRAWTGEAARFLRAHYRPGTGVIHFFGDLTGVLQQAGIPLRESLHQGNRPHWEAAVSRPDLFLWEEWALTISGDPVADSLWRSRRSGPYYDCVRTIAVRGAPVVQIFKRRAGTIRPPAVLTP
ncbi:MAG: glycosyltransferase family 39 protein [Bryobacteraceae bacterium]|nr:glycosyltransferase family 39 protein [Bryobacteraceae bacterium]